MKLRLLLLLTMAAAGGLAGVAQGELSQEGNLRVSVQGGISPRALPRTKMSPVAVWVGSTVTATDGSDPPPQLQRIAFAINRQGRIFDRGLPTCRARAIQPGTRAAALNACGGALVGRGHVRLRVAVDKDNPYTFDAPVLAFHARPAGGHRRILLHIYGVKPPSSFVLMFTVQRQPGVFGTVISTMLPPSTRRWAYLTHFDLRLQRTYMYRGKRRSFVSARCSAPPGFPGAVYPFAQAKLDFAGDRELRTTLVRNCAVRGS